MTNLERDADVVVAGAGAAGLAAAIKAADGGAAVALLEASSTFRQGSNTSMSTAMVPVAGSRWQEELGIDDSPDVLYQDIFTKTKGNADPVVARALVDVGRDLSEFLADDCELPLELLTDAVFPGHTNKRHLTVHDRSGRTMHRHLLEAAAKRENITMVVPLRVLDLVEIEDGWRVLAESPDGTRQELLTGSVVLATNGFGASPEHVAKHIPEVVEGLYFGGDHSLGDAIDIGERLGADTGFLDSYQGHGSVATPHGILITWTAMMNGAFLVNADGQRFGDETTGYSEFGVQVLAQPGAVAWMVFDEVVHEQALPFADYQQMVEAGIRWADDVAGLAAFVGCDEAAMSATLNNIAQFSSGGAADPLGRTLWPHELQPPYTAIKVTGALFHTQGGLLVNEHANVLRNGETIPGLYAAGGAAAGISGNGSTGYLSGNGLLSALGLGYLAGQAITTKLRRNGDS